MGVPPIVQEFGVHYVTYVCTDSAGAIDAIARVVEVGCDPPQGKGKSNDLSCGEELSITLLNTYTECAVVCLQMSSCEAYTFQDPTESGDGSCRTHAKCDGYYYKIEAPHWKLIAKQDIGQKKFDVSVKTTLLHDVDNPDSGAYMIVGSLDPNSPTIRLDGLYRFTLEFKQYHDQTAVSKTVWKQKRWLNSKWYNDAQFICESGNCAPGGCWNSPGGCWNFMNVRWVTATNDEEMKVIWKNGNVNIGITTAAISSGSPYDLAFSSSSKYLDIWELYVWIEDRRQNWQQAAFCRVVDRPPQVILDACSDRTTEGTVWEECPCACADREDL
jgi:hypothetical protein